MPPNSAIDGRGVFARNRGLIFPVLIVAAVLVIIAPLPPVAMDLLLACNITAAIIVLLTTIYVRRPVEFSVFPAVLLGTTLIRLVLNVASTRLILTRGGSEGTSAAGNVIEAFGGFVAGDTLVVGLILFAILLTIQFLVITKGATRVSEVAARFALDGMPGRQMAIDSDVAAGLLTQTEAHERREELAQQADFYGAMDGASKFVRGDAIASIVITFVNILGGLYIGLFENGMSLSQATGVFTRLTIGDGLVTQVPAFLIALAAGLIVTRTSVSSDLPQDFVSQLFRHPEAMALSAGFLFALAFTGLPTLPLLCLGTGCGVVGFILRSQRGQQNSETDATTEQLEPKTAKPEEKLAVNPLELELGVGLISLADKSIGGDLLDQVTNARHRIAQELGIILPKVSIRDNVRLESNDYQIKLRGIPIAWGHAYADGVLAIDAGNAKGELTGVRMTGLSIGRSATWIESHQKEHAESLGYRLVEPTTAIMTHLTEVARNHASELLTRQQVHQLIDNLKQSAPKLVEELIPSVVDPSLIQQVLSRLLEERVPVRDLETILETLGDYASQSRDSALLTEYVRAALARTICLQHLGADRSLSVVTLDATLEDVLEAGFDFSTTGFVNKLSSEISQEVGELVIRRVRALGQAGARPALLCSSAAVRVGLKQLTSNEYSRLVVLSYNEITRETQLKAVSQIRLDEVNSAAFQSFERSYAA
ncbi:MAG: EscV/YscV/HrcV family type III secretion system export apparatus protein [Planctomycetaceae bacterium]|nr:EscV/YscV/HrcV family type III secretion system export apparatus protein [Planctomycetaceae bacterium]